MAIGETRQQRNNRIRPYIDNARKLLNEKNIPFEERQEGIHFIVDHLFDFWPTTGKFINRETKKHGRGVFNLLRNFK